MSNGTLPYGIPHDYPVELPYNPYDYNNDTFLKPSLYPISSHLHTYEHILTKQAPISPLKKALWILAGIVSLVTIPPLLGVAILTGGAAVITLLFGAVKVSFFFAIDSLICSLAVKVAYKASSYFFSLASE